MAKRRTSKPKSRKVAETPVSVPEVSGVQGWRGSNIRAAIHDTGTGMRRFGASLLSKPARVMYSLAVLGAVGFGVYSVISLSVKTLDKYQAALSDPNIIMNEKNTGTTILDRNGVVLFQGYGAVDRHNVTLSEVPASLKEATLATEDPKFYAHAGFSWRGTARAAYQDIIHSGKVQGGSTISQQLVKTTLLSNEKSFTRKYQEILLSTVLERRYSKDQIFQMYLNSIYYGQGSYGVEAASQTYFHKPAKDLTLEESSLLAGLPQSPSRYDPTVNVEAATQRRNYVLSRMEETGYISPQTAQATEAKPVVAGTRDIVLKAPHFVFYVLDQLRKQYGEDKIENGGIVVRTTLDYSKQQAAESIVKSQITKLSGHNTTNAGLVSLDTHTGDIISMVGSVDYNQPGYGNVNVTLAQLQPGSSFKPIAYVTAFTKGWNGASVVDDKPVSFPQGDGSTYTPQNYDGKFRGNITLRSALANSLNIPAIEVLQYANLHDTITMAHSLGIQAPSLVDEKRFGLALVLGGGEVRPIDMAAVYAGFANEGKTVTPRAITSVDDKYGKNETKTTPDTSHQAIDPRIAYMITNILSDNKARTPEFGPHSPLVLSRPAAAKTGTTNDFRDNWTVGYTPDVATAVWAGNNDHSPMQNIDGITGAAPIWHDYMEVATAGTPVRDFVQPAGIVTAKVCSTDGGLVDGNDPNATNEIFLAEAAPTKHCGWAKGQKVSPTSSPATPTPAPTNPATPVLQQAQATPPPTTSTPGMGGGPGGGSTPVTTP